MAYYNAMHGALGTLYENELIKLADNPDNPDWDFDYKVYADAALWIHDRGGFKASMLKEQPALKVLEETMRVLGNGFNGSITHDVPDTLLAALNNNAFIFSGFKTYHSLNELGLKLTDEKGQIKPFNTFLADVQQVNAKYNQNYLYAEYNHAVHASQMAVKWHDFEEDEDRYNLQYRTAGDEKVRQEHAVLDGTTLPPSDPFWEQYLPPNGWNCRCNVVQVLKKKYPVSDSTQAISNGDFATSEPKQQIFRFNAGKTLELFPPKHPYYKAPKEAEQAIIELAKETVKEFTAQTIPEAESQFKDILGVKCDLSGFKKKDISQVKDIFDCVHKHFRDYPELKEKIGFVGSMQGRVKMLSELYLQDLKKQYAGFGYTDEKLKRTADSWARKMAYVRNCYAYSAPGQAKYGMNGLAYNTAWAGEKGQQSFDSDVASRFHPIGCNTVKSIFDHELGHKLDELLGLYKHPTFLNIYGTAKEKGAEYIRENLSGYAYSLNNMSRSNYDPRKEFLAEAWSEYLNNPEPRPIAKQVGEFIDSEYKNRMGQD